MAIPLRRASAPPHQPHAARRAMTRNSYPRRATSRGLRHPRPAELLRHAPHIPTFATTHAHLLTARAASTIQAQLFRATGLPFPSPRQATSHASHWTSRAQSPQLRLDVQSQPVATCLPYYSGPDRCDDLFLRRVLGACPAKRIAEPATFQSNFRFGSALLLFDDDGARERIDAALPPPLRAARSALRALEDPTRRFRRHGQDFPIVRALGFHSPSPRNSRSDQHHQLSGKPWSSRAMTRSQSSNENQVVDELVSIRRQRPSAPMLPIGNHRSFIRIHRL